MKLNPFETLTYRGQLRRLRRLAIKALIMTWIIELRNHPAFRDHWESTVKEILQDIRELVER